jgi:hypothetical protein
VAGLKACATDRNRRQHSAQRLTFASLPIRFHAAALKNARISERGRVAAFLRTLKVRRAAEANGTGRAVGVRENSMMSRVSWDLAIGRWLAACAHPVCAWRLRSTVVRAIVVTSYFTASYLSVLTVLLAL